MTRVQRCENPWLSGVEVDALDSLGASEQLSLDVEPHACKVAAQRAQECGSGRKRKKKSRYVVYAIL